METSLIIQQLEQYWLRLKKQWQLIKSGTSPQIHAFEHHNLFIVEYGMIHLTWEVENVHRVVISGVGDVTDRTEIMAKMPPNRQKMTITAYGGLKKTSCTIELSVAPIRAEKVLVKGMELPTPHVKSLGFQQKAGIFHKRNTVNKRGDMVRWPEPPQPADLKRLRDSLKNTLEVKKLAQLEAHLAQLKQQDLLHQQEIFNDDQTVK